jgi:hypothetical protein
MACIISPFGVTVKLYAVVNLEKMICDRRCFQGPPAADGPAGLPLPLPGAGWLRARTTGRAVVDSHWTRGS